MISSEDFELNQLEDQLQEASKTIWGIAQRYQGNSLALLTILRSLENIHREIRDGLFQESLPDNRQSLYKLLRDIEAKGGWPYIYRMKLQGLLENLEATLLHEPNSTSIEPDPSD